MTQEEAERVAIDFADWLDRNRQLIALGWNEAINSGVKEAEKFSSWPPTKWIFELYKQNIISHDT